MLLLSQAEDARTKAGQAKVAITFTLPITRANSFPAAAAFYPRRAATAPLATPSAQASPIPRDASTPSPRMNATKRSTARAILPFQLTTSLAAYSPLPFNITTGANTIQGTGARPTINGAFINRNAGEGHAILNLNVRLSRSFALSERTRLQVLAEMFNTLNHVNVVTLNGVFGTGVYPTAPSSTFGQITAVNDPRTAQFGLRLSF